jgi:isoleucyl-tRNA synthetase
MWSPVERTALAEAEVEYYDRKVPVIWVKFPVLIEAGDGPKLHPVIGASVVIWTTTPWTIPANQAVSFSPEIAYGLYTVDAVMSEEELGFAPYARSGEKLVLSDALAQSVMDGAKVSAFTRVGDIDPTGWTLKHPLSEMDPFFDKPIPMLSGEHVTADAGTGFVHTAPAHGEDDFNVWVESGHTTQEIRQIVDADGCYTPDVPRFAGMDIVRTSGKKRGAGRERQPAGARHHNDPRCALLALQGAGDPSRDAAMVHLDGQAGSERQVVARECPGGHRRDRILSRDGTQPPAQHGRRPTGLADQPPAQLGRTDHDLCR